MSQHYDTGITTQCMNAVLPSKEHATQALLAGCQNGSQLLSPPVLQKIYKPLQPSVSSTVRIQGCKTQGGMGEIVLRLLWKTSCVTEGFLLLVRSTKVVLLLGPNAHDVEFTFWIVVIED